MKKALIILSLIANWCFANEVKIGFPASVPPFVEKDTNSGVELEIMREAFKAKDYTLVPNFYSAFRVFEELDKGIIEGGNVGTDQIQENVNGFYGNRMINHCNAAISLKSKNLSIKSLQDLNGKNIIAFQNAMNKLGDDYSNLMKDDQNYKEVADQTLQPLMLYNKRTELVICEINIFNYLASQVQDKADIAQALNIDFIFPKDSPYNVPVFKQKEIRDIFNDGLNIIKANGTYNKIIEKYKLITCEA